MADSNYGFTDVLVNGVLIPTVSLGGGNVGISSIAGTLEGRKITGLQFRELPEPMDIVALTNAEFGVEPNFQIVCDNVEILDNLIGQIITCRDMLANANKQGEI